MNEKKSLDTDDSIHWNTRHINENVDELGWHYEISVFFSYYIFTKYTHSTHPSFVILPKTNLVDKTLQADASHCFLNYSMIMAK